MVSATTILTSVDTSFTVNHLNIFGGFTVKMRRLVTGLAMAGMLVASMAANAEMNAAQKKDVEGVVRNYLVQNPDVVVQSLQAYQQKQMDEARKTMQKTQDSSPKFADALFHQANDPVTGNPKGKVTVVEFFDYQCPHCVDMDPVMTELVKNNPDVRVIFKEFPIRGPVSELAARAALAAKEQGKYMELHHAMMQTKSEPLSLESIMKLAQNVGLDVAKLKADMNKPVVNEQIKATYKLAQDLQLLGTPAIFVAKSTINNASPASAIVFVPGQVTQEQMNEILKKMN
jgi:protein-disulfide isomerase